MLWRRKRLSLDLEVSKEIVKKHIFYKSVFQFSEYMMVMSQLRAWPFFTRWDISYFPSLILFLKKSILFQYIHWLINSRKCCFFA